MDTKFKQSLNPANTVYSPLNGLLRKNNSKTAVWLCLLDFQYEYAIVIWYKSVSNGRINSLLGNSRAISNSLLQCAKVYSTTSQRLRPISFLLSGCSSVLLGRTDSQYGTVLVKKKIYFTCTVFTVQYTGLHVGE